MSDPDRTMVLTEDREPVPIGEVVTGRGFITGKSGSGKSNTASVVCEELLEAGVPLMIVDTDGEYYGLKERYELLHVGADDRCDMRVGPQHAEKIAELALESALPIILDVSAYKEAADGERLVHDVVQELFTKEKQARVPFLLLIEEAHEFIPEKGGLDEVGEMLIRVAKRGRKRGLGVLAISQRPASVDKDYITQCDWLVWHRLTWQNDTDVVKRILGSQAAEDVQALDPGEAIMMADWEDGRRRVKFRRKRTLDAGATPDLDDIGADDPQDLRTDLVDELEQAGASRTEDGRVETIVAGNEDADDAASSDGEPAATSDGGAVAEESGGDGAGPDAPSPGETDLEQADLEAAAAGEGEAGGATDGADDSAGTTETADQHHRDDGGRTAESGTAARDDDATGTGTAGAPAGEAASESSPATADGARRSTPANRSATPEPTEQALERAAAQVRPARPNDDGGAQPAGAAVTPTPDPERAEDPVWEAAELVVYVVGALGATTVATGARVERALASAVGRGGPRTERLLTAESGPRGRPLVGLLVVVTLLLVGAALGVGAASLLA